MKAREGQVHLRLDPCGAGDAASRRPFQQDAKQGGLAYSGLASQHQNLATASLRGRHEAAQPVGLVPSSQQDGRRAGGGHVHLPELRGEVDG
jgi:hypothetical protein